MKLSEFLESNVSPFLLGVFFSRYIFTKDKTKIYSEISYKISKFVPDYKLLEESKNELQCAVNKICEPFGFWDDHTNKNSKTPIMVLRFSLENDLNLEKDNFYNKLLAKIFSQDFIADANLNEDKKMFIRGFAESRGSIDTTRPFLAMDYFYNSLIEVKRARMLYDYFNVPFSVLNFNPRELQNDYITGKNRRNTQLRFNLFWYVKNIGVINLYKAQIIKNVYNNISPSFVKQNVHFFNAPEIVQTKKDSFDFMLGYYSNNIFGKKLSDFEIKNIREELDFDTDNTTSTFKRDISRIEIVRWNTPDICASCGATKTYTQKNTGRQYFEFHHVISLGKNHDLDDENNIVKLCPTCHRIVKRGSAQKSEQITVIKNILKNQPNVLEFAKHIYDTENFNDIVEKIWENLK